MKNNDGAGATQVKGGDNAAAIERPKGMAQATAALSNKTRSRHKGTGKHNQYEDCPTGYGDDNIKT